MTVADKPQRNGKGQFLKGAIGLGGRKPGSRVKLEEAFVADLCASWAIHGPVVLETLATKEPAQYAKIAASVLPKHSHHTVEKLELKSDAELAAIIQAGLGERSATSVLPMNSKQDTKH
jgi:hypothetical protein